MRKPTFSKVKSWFKVISAEHLGAQPRADAVLDEALDKQEGHKRGESGVGEEWG